MTSVPLADGLPGGGTPLWLVCGLVFAGLLGLALLILLGPGSAAARRSRQARMTEVRRYRLPTAGGAARVEEPTPAPQQRSIVTQALRLTERLVRARGQRRRIVGRLEPSGIRMRPEEWAAIEICATVTGGALVVFATRSFLGVLLGAPVGWLACHTFLSVMTTRRRKAFEQQLPDALQRMAGALRTGFGLGQSIGAVANDGVDPVAEEFARALQEVRLGAELEDALDSLAERMASYDLELVVMAIRTAREVGGNLAEVLQTTVATMRERAQLRRQVQVLSAEGRFSAKVLTGLPMLMAAYLFLFKRDYLKTLYTTSAGIAMLAVGVLLLVVGSVWLHKLTKIEV